MRRAHVTAGVLCPTLTPVLDDGTPCVDLLLEHCRWLLSQGCSGIVLFGTTGEANSFTVAERRAVLEALVTGGMDPESLVAGTGCCAAGDTVALTAHALSLGVRRVLVLPPFYYKHVSDAGVIDAYARTIEAVADPELRLYLYRIPQMSGVDIKAAVIESLLARYPDAVSGIKDSSGDWPSMRALCETFGGAIDVLVGSERHLNAAMALGAAGCVTATANVNPRRLRDLYETRDDALQQEVNVVRDTFEGSDSIAKLKSKTALRTGDARWRNVRPPLVPQPAAGGD